MKRGTIFLDVDGILLDFNKCFATFCNNHEIRESAEKISDNPECWKFSDQLRDNHERVKLFEEFFKFHPIMELTFPNIPDILHILREKYNIELVTGYKDEEKRLRDLIHNKIPFDNLNCGISDKLAFIKNKESLGENVIAIMEDSPETIDSYLSEYPNKIWAPKDLNFLKHYINTEQINLYETPESWLTI